MTFDEYALLKHVRKENCSQIEETVSDQEQVELKTTIINPTNVNETNDDIQMTNESIKDEEDPSNKTLQ